jgi:hypothetical protein
MHQTCINEYRRIPGAKVYRKKKEKRKKPFQQLNRSVSDSKGDQAPFAERQKSENTRQEDVYLHQKRTEGDEGRHSIHSSPTDLTGI